MRGLAVVCSLVAASACASSGGLPEQRPAQQTIEIGGMPGKLTVNSSSTANVTKVALAMEQIWRVLPATFDSLGVPITRLEPAKHLIGNEGFKLRQRLGKTTLSRYLDCGTTQIGANADSYDVYLTVMTQLQPGDAGVTTVSTTFEAVARPLAFAQDYSKCSSKGLFESRLVELVKAQVK
jgi:hypothetical protein